MKEKSQIKWKTDADGMLLGARAHDGQVIDLSYSKSCVSFRVERVAGGVVEFKLNGVTELNLALWEGTILSEVFAWKLSSRPQALSQASSGAWEFLYRNRVSDLKSEIERTVKKRPESLLVHMLSSYGGEIVAICSSVEIYDES